MANYELINTLSKRFFWDIDLQRFDEQKNKRIIIERVATNGDINEFKKIIEYYGLDVVRKELVNAGNLDKKTLNWLSHIFSLDKKEFKCYSKILSNQKHWSF